MSLILVAADGRAGSFVVFVVSCLGFLTTTKETKEDEKGLLCQRRPGAFYFRVFRVFRGCNLF